MEITKSVKGLQKILVDGVEVGTVQAIKVEKPVTNGTRVASGVRKATEFKITVNGQTRIAYHKDDVAFVAGQMI